MELNNISKRYKNKKNEVLALDNISLKFAEKGLTIILGSSGSGKTTLLNIIAQLDKDYNGEIKGLISASYLTQNIELFENFSVIDNINLVVKDKLKSVRYLKRFNLMDIRNKKVKHCSQGQKRRVQLLCAYLNDKQMLLLDEPTAALDHDNSMLIMQMVKEIAKDKLVIMITHDIALANNYADRLIEIDKGKIINNKVLVHHDLIDSNYQNKSKQSITNDLQFVLKILFLVL